MSYSGYFEYLQARWAYYDFIDWMRSVCKRYTSGGWQVAEVNTVAAKTEDSCKPDGKPP